MKCVSPDQTSGTSYPSRCSMVAAVKRHPWQVPNRIGLSTGTFSPWVYSRGTWLEPGHRQQGWTTRTHVHVTDRGSEHQSTRVC